MYGTLTPDVTSYAVMTSHVKVGEVNSNYEFVTHMKYHERFNQCCFNVGLLLYDDGPTLTQHWVNASLFPGSRYLPRLAISSS